MKQETRLERAFRYLKVRAENPKRFWVKNNIRMLLTQEDLKFIWNRDKAFKMKMPVLHRIDNLKDYTLQNCKYMERKDHTKLHIDLSLYNKWSRKYSKCIECGTTKIKHMARGRCIRCESRLVYKNTTAH